MINMSEKTHVIAVDMDLAKQVMSDSVYESNASAFREQFVNALSHGCQAYHKKYGYTDDVYVRVVMDKGHRKVTIHDNGMGMSQERFLGNFMSFGYNNKEAMSVKSDTINERAGQFGLGAISFFRLARACIVESWDRETNEHYAWMTRDQSITEKVGNMQLTGPGTITDIYLKDDVNIDSLRDMVKKVCEVYPVRVTLEVINSEQSQSISTYSHESDSFVEFPAVLSFAEHVKKVTNDYAVVVDNEFIEAYLIPSQNYNASVFLCNVPIESKVVGSRYDRGLDGFNFIVNIKQEKYWETPDKDLVDQLGEIVEAELKPIPQINRDRIQESADLHIMTTIRTALQKFLQSLDFTTTERLLNNEHRWILTSYSIDDKVNSKSHDLITKLRGIDSKYRTSEGYSSRSSSSMSLFRALTGFDVILYHHSCSNVIFKSLDRHFSDKKVVMLGKGLYIPESLRTNKSLSDFDIIHSLVPQIIDAKEYKKQNKVESVKYEATQKDNSAVIWLSHWGSSVKYGDYQPRLPDENIFHVHGTDVSKDIIMNRQLFEAPYFSNHSGRHAKEQRVGVVVSQNTKNQFTSLRVLDVMITDMIAKEQLMWYSQGRFHKFDEISLNFAADERPAPTFRVCIMPLSYKVLLENKFVANKLLKSENSDVVLLAPREKIFKVALALSTVSRKRVPTAITDAHEKSRSYWSCLFYIFTTHRTSEIIKFLRDNPNWKTNVSDERAFDIKRSIEQEMGYYKRQDVVLPKNIEKTTAEYIYKNDYYGMQIYFLELLRDHKDVGNLPSLLVDLESVFEQYSGYAKFRKSILYHNPYDKIKNKYQESIAFVTIESPGMNGETVKTTQYKYIQPGTDEISHWEFRDGSCGVSELQFTRERGQLFLKHVVTDHHIIENVIFDENSNSIYVTDYNDTRTDSIPPILDTLQYENEDLFDIIYNTGSRKFYDEWKDNPEELLDKLKLVKLPKMKEYLIDKSYYLKKD
jgi:hypothetical protein